MKSNTYRRSKADSQPHTKWEYIYGSIAAKLLRKHKLHTDNVFALAKFLAVFVYAFDYIYTPIKLLYYKRKFAKIARK